MFACSLVADKANFSSELSKCKQSKSILKVMTLMMPWLRHFVDQQTINEDPRLVLILHIYLMMQSVAYES